MIAKTHLMRNSVLRPTSIWILPCLFLAFAAAPALAGPRDAAAVILHCGQPTLEDTTVLNDHTVAGGHRTLRYLSGTLHFERVGNDGWNFTDGAHRKQEHLTAEELGHFMPCLTAALADSAAPVPLQPVTTTERVETSMKRPYEKLIGGALLVLVVLTILYFAFGRRPAEQEDD